MSVPFGFSVGDCLATLGVVREVIDALRESGTARSEYEEVLRQLESLEAALSHASLLRSDGHPLYSDLQRAVARCRLAIDDFEARNRKYDVSMRTSTSRSLSLKARWRKVKWAVCKKEEVAKFKSDLAGHTSYIQSFLTQIGLLSSREHSEKLDQIHQAVPTQAQAACQCAQDVAALSANLANFMTMVNNTLMTMSEQMVTSDMMLAQKIDDMHVSMEHTMKRLDGAQTFQIMNAQDQAPAVEQRLLEVDDSPSGDIGSDVSLCSVRIRSSVSTGKDTTQSPMRSPSTILNIHLGSDLSDFVTQIQILSDSLNALQEHSMMKESCKELIHQLNLLQIALYKIAELGLFDEMREELATLKTSVQQCQRTISDFYSYIYEVPAQLKFRHGARPVLVDQELSMVQIAPVNVALTLARKSRSKVLRRDLALHTDVIQATIKELCLKDIEPRLAHGEIASAQNIVQEWALLWHFVQVLSDIKGCITRIHDHGKGASGLVVDIKYAGLSISTSLRHLQTIFIAVPFHINSLAQLASMTEAAITGNVDTDKATPLRKYTLMEITTALASVGLTEYIQITYGVKLLLFYSHLLRFASYLLIWNQRDLRYDCAMTLSDITLQTIRSCLDSNELEIWHRMFHDPNVFGVMVIKQILNLLLCGNEKSHFEASWREERFRKCPDHGCRDYACIDHSFHKATNKRIRNSRHHREWQI